MKGYGFCLPQNIARNPFGHALYHAKGFLLCLFRSAAIVAYLHVREASVFLYHKTQDQSSFPLFGILQVLLQEFPQGWLSSSREAGSPVVVVPDVFLLRVVEKCVFYASLARKVSDGNHAVSADDDGFGESVYCISICSLGCCLQEHQTVARVFHLFLFEHFTFLLVSA